LAPLRKLAANVKLKRDILEHIEQSQKGNKGDPRGSQMKKRKLLQKLLSGSKNIRFSEAVTCAKAFGFNLSRINGDHHIYVHPEVPELENLQDVGGKAKPYQVRQLLQIIERYNLQLEEEE
jgi:predicted RNA binding protein YcfA (HicA-like mRNA interferase family)